MPPRHAYWTILIDNQPTAFRAHDAEELLPTLNRLREKNASAVMKWFERGQLFESRDAARDAGFGRGERRWEGPRPERNRDDSPGPDRDARRARAPQQGEQDRRDKNWRPGGTHRDPRQKYKDAKKAKWTRFKQNVRERHEGRSTRDSETFSSPHGDPLRPTYSDRRQRPGDRPRGPAKWQSPRREERDQRPSRPHGDQFRTARSEQSWRPRDDDRRVEDRRDRRFESRGGTRKPEGWTPAGNHVGGSKRFPRKPFGAKSNTAQRGPQQPNDRRRRRRDEDE